jgi:hypothetical protein
MPFLTSTDISSQLPSGFNTALVDRFLLRLEQEFKNMDLVFTAPVLEFRKLKTFEVPDKIFDFTPFNDLVSIKIKSFDGTFEKVLTNQDYILSTKMNFDTYNNRIELIDYSISTPHYLEINAKFGIYIDFTADTEASKLLEAIVVDAVIKQLDYASSSYQQVASAGSGESRVSFTNSKNREYYSSISEDPEFANALSYFL